MPRPNDPSIPYNALPKLPPSCELETARTLKKANSANKALVALKYSGRMIPNQSLLIRSIVLQEAKLSSEIENIVTTNDELYRAFASDSEVHDAATKEVLRYQQAVWQGYRALRDGRPISPALLVSVAGEIKHPSIDVRTLPGTRVVNMRTNEPIYSPPEGEALLRDLLLNLCEYLNDSDEVDPLIKMAVAHYQFEAIHPFADGNGRTGRVMNTLYLVDQGLLDVPVLYLSRYIIDNKDRYYDLLRRVTEVADWESWILYMLDAVESTAKDTEARIEDIRTALDSSAEHARNAMKIGYSRELLDLVFQQPYTRISDLERHGIAKRVTASVYLKSLVECGILRSIKAGRGVLFINDTLLDILTR